MGLGSLWGKYKEVTNRGRVVDTGKSLGRSGQSVREIERGYK